MIYYVSVWGGLVLFVIILYLIRRKRINALIKKIDKLNTEHNKLLKEQEIKQQALDELTKKITTSSIELAQLDKERIIFIERGQEARAATEQLLATEQERVAAELRFKEEQMKRDFEIKEAALQCQYNWRKQQFEEDFENLLEFYHNEIDLTKEELNEYAAKRTVVNEAILRERELEEKEDFYRIVIKDTDTRDIEVLHSIESHLCNREVLNKLIYEVFIKRPLMEMEKRVLQGRKVGGIYKITYIKTGESYIGRSVDIGNRWKEHCLSSLNIGSIAHSTFHNVLADKGLWNFTWEVLEEVDKEKQASREKYWIDFYQTDKQFNQRLG